MRPNLERVICTYIM